MNASRAIRAIHAKPDGWVRVEQVRRGPGRSLQMILGVAEGRRGALREAWLVTCRGVRELCLTDLDGGGLQLWPASHPAARQYSDPTASLICKPSDLRAAVGALYEAHASAVDDWVPFEQYLGFEVPAPSKLERLRARGPRFLMNKYARALRALGIACALAPSGRRDSRRPACRVLHFGDSYVVAEEFSMAPVPNRLANNRMQLTKREGGPASRATVRVALRS